jgi:hypothetical protein
MPLINTTSSKYFAIGGSFLLAGIVLAYAIPYFITPKPGPDDILTSGQVIDFAVAEDEDDDTKAEIFSYTLNDGQQLEAQNSIWSSSPSYKIGDKIEVYYSKSEPEKSWIKDDKNLVIMNYILYGLGIYFSLLGLGIIGLKFRNMENVKIEVLIGSIGALSYGIPATFALPALYYAFLARPNFLFDETVTAFPQDTMFIGLIFTVTGLIDLAAVMFMLRHYKKTGSNKIGADLSEISEDIDL